ncbi:MAG: D-glycero-beta-D-manno-heptose 1-phosphate adenylyltransferase [Acidobacteria bacterium]|jgi:D-beta-D-heptose 7-phosphate kinase/D-beta-D-heptose 1-phosphate adenosyltransferase|nr:D-glycero-beta-D-manno-heptose 1-phosphate adenylyltransferase [Acidobacteriota bacterium]
MRTSKSKIKSRQELQEIVAGLKSEGKTVVFTNGCFDLLHPGHVRYLEKARAEGDVLVVALNSDDSVRKIKGEDRPVLSEEERSEIIGSLGCVDFVTTFEEDTPENIIEELVPTVLVKGGDWPVDKILGRQVVEENSGRVISIDFEEEYSTSNILKRIRG